MAAPHGVKLKDLTCDFTDNISAHAHQDAQFEFGKHDVPVFDLDVGKISDALSLHGGLDPSILSIFQEKIATESVESEASLLSALSEILDSVDVETLSPFDVLPDADIFSARKDSNYTLRDLLHSDPAAALQGPKTSQSPKSGKEVVISDRQLRPRRHSETQSKISQRADDEKNPRESKRSARSFRIESDTIFPQDEREFLADLVRHMHPYCIRTDPEKEVHVSVEEEEEEEFVDVEGYEEPEGNQSGQDPKAESGSSRIPKSEKDEDVFGDDGNISSLDKRVLTPAPQRRSALLKTREKNRKTVTFAVNLTLVHEIPPDDESDSDSESTSSKSDITSPQKPKALSLQQYRLLRQNKQPREETRKDYRTKWPSLPDFPRELPAILPDLIKVGPKLNVNACCGAIDKAPTVEVKISASQPREITRSSRVKLRRPENLCTDPPNPVLVRLKPMLSSGINTQPALTHSQADVCVSREEVRPAEVVPVIIKATDSATRTGSEPSDSVPTPTSVAENPEGQQNQTPCGEIGIEATDLTSLLEQFETQASEGPNLPDVSRDEHQDGQAMDLSSTAGLTPPATPPHQTWKPLVPVKATKSSKTIQIIEPRPLPPSKTHSKLPTFTPASNPAQLFLDHDYCGILGSKTPFNSVSSPCDYRVLLSPDSSPCRTDTLEEAEGLRFSAPSPSPLDRGRRKRRGYDGGYRRSRSRSSCSSCSSSSSSSPSRSRSPPKKRYRSRHSGSSSSSRSSSRSSSPPRERRSRSRSRSLRGSRSGSHSPEPDWSESRCTWKSRRQKELIRLREEARKLRQQKAIEERRVVYVGGIRGNMSPSDLKDRFSLFGKVEDCTIHIRSHG
ncbi:peroxisome proliferator-activated receptor gamma coactivator-related protein [Pimephales promelas]|nr:peroxisome proliferator-activated receptor gamma coactivator-related protein [Pimephales promelas]